MKSAGLFRVCCPRLCPAPTPLPTQASSSLLAALGGAAHAAGVAVSLKAYEDAASELAGSATRLALLRGDVARHRVIKHTFAI